MAILTLSDLENATDKEIESVLKEMELASDLATFLSWVNSPDGEAVKGSFSLGYHERSLGIHPSTISKKGTCPLRIYYEITGDVDPKKHFPTNIQLTFDLGTMLHEMLQAFFRDMYEDHFKAEIPLRDKRLMIKSHTDGRFDFGDLKFLLEIKSIKEGGGYGIDEVRNKPMKDHLRQAHCYMYCDDTPFCNIFYFCKNTSEIIEHPIVFNPKVWAEIEEEIEPVVEAVNAKEPPTPKVGSHCRDCPFQHGCKWGTEHVQSTRGSRRHAVRRRSAKR